MVFWKYALNLQENTHAEVRFKQSFTLRHECPPVNLVHIFRSSFFKNSYGALLLKRIWSIFQTLFPLMKKLHSDCVVIFYGTRLKNWRLNTWCSTKQSVEVCNFVKKQTPGQVFSSEFCEIIKNTFFIEQLSGTAFNIDQNYLKKLMSPKQPF